MEVKVEISAQCIQPRISKRTGKPIRKHMKKIAKESKSHNITIGLTGSEGSRVCYSNFVQHVTDLIDNLTNEASRHPSRPLFNLHYQFQLLSKVLSLHLCNIHILFFYHPNLKRTYNQCEPSMSLTIFSIPLELTTQRPVLPTVHHSIGLQRCILNMVYVIHNRWQVQMPSQVPFSPIFFVHFDFHCPFYFTIYLIPYSWSPHYSVLRAGSAVLYTMIRTAMCLCSVYITVLCHDHYLW